MHLPSDPRLAWAGAIIQVGFKEMQGTQCGHNSSHPWAIVYVRPGALGQVRHRCKSLSYVAEYLVKFVENNVPINQ